MMENPFGLENPINIDWDGLSTGTKRPPQSLADSQASAALMHEARPRTYLNGQELFDAAQAIRASKANALGPVERHEASKQRAHAGITSGGVSGGNLDFIARAVGTADGCKSAVEVERAALQNRLNMLKGKPRSARLADHAERVAELEAAIEELGGASQSPTRATGKASSAGDGPLYTMLKQRLGDRLPTPRVTQRRGESLAAMVERALYER